MCEHVYDYSQIRATNSGGVEGRQHWQQNASGMYMYSVYIRLTSVVNAVL